jgi:hypothetical protein
MVSNCNFVEVCGRFRRHEVGHIMSMIMARIDVSHKFFGFPSHHGRGQAMKSKKVELALNLRHQGSENQTISHYGG